MKLRNEQAPRPGAAVYSRDGHSIGSVAEVLGDYFRVTGDERDYWFGLEHIERGSEARLDLDFAQSEVLTHDVPPPTNHEQSEYLDGPLSEEEQAQRELMLRQLAEQREAMRESGAATAEADDSLGEPVEEELRRKSA